MSVNNYVNVAINIGGKTQTVKIEKGCLFENNGGQYVVDEKGVLNIFDKKTGQWKKTGAINMTQYQFNTFKAVANNTKEGEGITLSKNDILRAQDKFKKGQFTEDMSEFLVNGYHIEKPEMSTKDKYIKAHVTNGNEGQSATLKFQIAELDNLKQASTEYQKEKNATTSDKQPTKGRASTVGKEALDKLDPDHDGKFKIDRNDFKSWKLPVPIELGGLSDKDEKLLFDKLESLNGQKITPDLIDKITNILLDINNPAKGVEINFEGEGYTTESMLFDFARFAQYLKPETITKLLSEKNIVNIEGNGDPNHSKNLKSMKNLYGRLTPAQKDIYYRQILTENANTGGVPFSYQSDGKALADYIFEKPVSSQNFNRIKTLVIAMNKPNGVAGTKDECKELINTLKAQGKITQAQANELFKAGNIKH